MQQPSTSSSATMANNSWASGSRASVTNVPRSTSVEYEKETQATSAVRRFAPPPNRLAPPARSNGSGTIKRPISKQSSLRQVPDSEDEEDYMPPSRNERGKSPMEQLSAAVVQTYNAIVPTSFNMHQRSQEPTAPADTSGNSYDYSYEERLAQEKIASARTVHKKGGMSVDNKAYRPSQSDLDESEEDDDEEKRTRRRKAKKGGPAGGPLTSLPMVGQDKRKKRKSKGSKSNALDEDEVGSDEDQSEQRSMSHRSVPNSRASQSRGSIPLYPRDDSGAIDTSADTAPHLDSIDESAELSVDIENGDFSSPEHPKVSARSVNQSTQLPTQPFSIGASIGRLVHSIWRAGCTLLAMLFVLLGQIVGNVLDVVLIRPYRWLTHTSPGLGSQLAKMAVVGLTLWTAWYALQRGNNISFADWIPSRSSGKPYQAPEVPAANIAELSARLQSIENALSGLSLDQERARARLESEVKQHAEVAGRLGSLESRVQKENARAAEGEQVWRSHTSQGLQAVRSEVEALQAQLRAQQISNSGKPERTDKDGTDEEARARLRALEERVGSVEGGVKEALEIGKTSAKTGSGPGAAWWNKLGSGRGGLTIKTTEGQDVMAVIGHLVDSAVSMYNKDDLARPDLALHSAGGRVIPSLTSPTIEIRPRGVGAKVVSFLSGGSGYAIGLPPVTALHHERHDGHCWPIEGTEGQLAVALSSPAYISDITIDHVAKEVASDIRSAPREMEVWGMVEGQDNIAKVQAWLKERAVKREDARERGFEVDEEPAYPKTLPAFPQYLRLASFTYDIHAPKNIQTFPVDEEIQRLGVDFGIVALRMKSNWGQDAYTCLYRFRVHGEKLGSISDAELA